MGQAKIRAANKVRYEQGLQKKYKLLKASCTSYDAGASEEVDRMATEIISLCHSGAAQSILSGLGYGRKEIFFDTAGALPSKGLMSQWEPLTLMRMGNSNFDFMPILDSHPTAEKKKLNAWWKYPVLKRFFHEFEFQDGLTDEENDILENMLSFHQEYKNQKKLLLSDLQSKKIYPHISLSRRNIILDIRNTEGAHFVKSKSLTKKLFGELEDQGFVAFQGSVELLPKNTAMSATIRQISYELLRSIESEFKYLCN